jgi:hypothetical protein
MRWFGQLAAVIHLLITAKRPIHAGCSKIGAVFPPLFMHIKKKKDAWVREREHLEEPI